MENPLEKELESIGLNEKEAKVYLAGLELGPATAQELAAKATVARPSTYIAIETLTQKGLMSTFTKGKRKMFVAADPAHLSFLIEARRRQLDVQSEVAKRLIDKMRSNKQEAPSEIAVEVYEGSHATSHLLEMLASHSGGEVLEAVNIEDARKFIPPLDTDDDPRRDHVRNFGIKSLTFEKAGEAEPSMNSRAEERMLSSDEYDFSGEILIIGEKVCFTSFSDVQRTVVIQSHELARTVTTMFYALWEKAVTK